MDGASHSHRRRSHPTIASVRARQLFHDLHGKGKDISDAPFNLIARQSLDHTSTRSLAALAIALRRCRIVRQRMPPRRADDDLARTDHRGPREVRARHRRASRRGQSRPREAAAARSSAIVRPQTANGKKWLAYLEVGRLQASSSPPKASRIRAARGDLRATQQRSNGPRTQAVPRSLRRAATLHRPRRDGPAGRSGRHLRRASSTGSPRNWNSTRRLRRPPPARRSAAGSICSPAWAKRRNWSPPSARSSRSRTRSFTVSTDLLRDAAADPINRHDPITDVILGTRIRGHGHTDRHRVAGHRSERRQGRHQAHDRRPRRFAKRRPQRPGRDSQHRLHRFRRRRSSSSSRDSSFRALPAQVVGHDPLEHPLGQQGRRRHGPAHRRQRRHAKGPRKAGPGQSHRRRSRRSPHRPSHDRRDRQAARQGLESLSERLSPAARAPRRTAASTRASARPTTRCAFETTQANRGQLAAPAAPPELARRRATSSLRLHESAINNYTAALLSGATLSETKPGEGTKADVHAARPGSRTPGRIAWTKRPTTAADADFEPWSLTFRRDRPITVAFVDGKVQLTLHLAQLEVGRRCVRPLGRHRAPTRPSSPTAA